MTIDTEPTIRLPVVDVPSAVITTEHRIARAQHQASQRARSQARWDRLAQLLSYLCFGGILILLVGITVTGIFLVLSLRGDQTAVPLPEPPVASVTSLPTLTVPGPVLGGVTAASTTTTPKAAKPTTTAPVRSTTTPPPATTARPTPAPTTTVPAPTPSPTTAASITTTAVPSTPAPTEPPTTTASTEPATTTTADTTPTT